MPTRPQFLAGPPLPGVGDNVAPLSVVRRDLELEFVTRTVEQHQNGLDEWNGDFLDAALTHRHHARLRSIEDQAVVRTQQASDLEEVTRQALTEAGIRTAAARQAVARAQAEVDAWARVLTGLDAQYVPPSGMPSPAKPSDVAAPVQLPSVPGRVPVDLPAGWVWKSVGGETIHEPDDTDSDTDTDTGKRYWRRRSEREPHDDTDRTA